jgi:hypothetical protein
MEKYQNIPVLNCFSSFPLSLFYPTFLSLRKKVGLWGLYVSLCGSVPPTSLTFELIEILFHETLNECYVMPFVTTPMLCILISFSE